MTTKMSRKRINRIKRRRAAMNITVEYGGKAFVKNDDPVARQSLERAIDFLKRNGLPQSIAEKIDINSL